ncbi:MAG TPA: hypothetical protein PKD45_04020 [Flavobacteriales bacterium]|nr:hypothetical protein [Flavobacteriales bacterium]
MILYLTYNDQPTGVYWSQVTDVVAHLNTLGGPRVRLLALVSARDYFGIRRKIRAHSPDAIVLPMVPRMKHWRANTAVVQWACRRLKPSAIIARGVLATWMALRARDQGRTAKVCLDARGAYAAEWEEYRIIDDDALIAQFRAVEQEAVERSDLRLAVSHALVEHWRERYGYQGNDHVVIPCTLAATHLAEGGDPQAMREQLGFTADDVVLVYSGSSAGWQSFALLERLLGLILGTQPRTKVLFLSPPDPAIEALSANWLGRSLRMWVQPSEVHAVLNACDHALLVREDTITNRVASPTKFAEYLSCGLPVIASKHIGDFSATILHESLGLVQGEEDVPPLLERPSDTTRSRIRGYALAHYTKAAHNDTYRHLLRQLGA